MGIYRMVGGAECPALKAVTGELFADCEKFAILQKLNGRGERIRTSDPLLPKRNRQKCRILTALGWG